MRNFSKKALSLISSAVLLCGAGAIPASAESEITTTKVPFTQLMKENELIKTIPTEVGENVTTTAVPFSEMKIENEYMKTILTEAGGAVTTTVPIRFDEQIKRTLPLTTLPSDDALLRPRLTTGNRPRVTTTTTTAASKTTTTTTAPCKLAYHLNTKSGQIGGSVSQVTIKLVKDSSCQIPSDVSVNYQWYKDGTTISGATSDSYPATSTGTYYCAVSATRRVRRIDGRLIPVTVDSFTTEYCVITEKLEIKTQPKGGYIYKSGSTYALSVEAKGGTAPYKYEWLLNGTVVGRNQTYNAPKAGTYKCRITDSKGNTVTSNSAIVTENFLRITSQPKDVIICNENGRYIYANVAGGKAPYTYKWYSGNAVIGTNSYLNVTDPGTYYCVITDSLNSTVTTNKVKATINFYSLKQGLPKTFNIENTRTVKDFTVSVQGGTGHYQYAWQSADIGSSTWTEFYRSDITTATSNTRTIYLNAYNKKYRCIIYSMDGNAYAASVGSGVMNVTKPLKVKEVKHYTQDGYYYVDYKVEGGYGSYYTTGTYSNLGSNTYRTRGKIYRRYTGSGSTYQSGAGWYSRIFYDYYAEQVDLKFIVTDSAGNCVDKSECRNVGSYSVKTGEDTWANF